MSKWGSFDYSDIKKLAGAFQKANDERVIERFIREFMAEMAMRALRKVKKLTPVESGELRRNWKVTNVFKQGNSYVVELYNNTDYAQFIEYGHRSGIDLTEWTEGRFMMTISIQEIERELPIYLDKRMTQLLNDIMNGRPPKRG